MNRLEIIIPVQEVLHGGAVKQVDEDRLNAIETIIVHTLICSGIQNIMCNNDKIILMCNDGIVHHLDSRVYYCYYSKLSSDVLDELEETIEGYVEQAKLIRNVSA